MVGGALVSRLVLSRDEGERTRILFPKSAFDLEVEIYVVRARSGQVKLAFTAPEEVRIERVREP